MSRRARDDAHRSSYCFQMRLYGPVRTKLTQRLQPRPRSDRDWMRNPKIDTVMTTATPIHPTPHREPGAFKPRRIVVAMSGGVDSSVAAAVLKAEGHEVIGITLQLYDHGVATKKKGACCAGQDIHDARRVADAIGIPHYVLDYETRFQTAVMQSFADSYLAGETPIPCVACNSQIKFKELLDTARDLGADALATGHYIQRTEGPDGPELRRANDPDRDQSYFLFTTTREQLAQLWFPLGHLPKARVRELAVELNLPVAAKPDSQDICFVPSGRYADVIQSKVATSSISTVAFSAVMTASSISPSVSAAA
jgi:tRNA (5-methylaminomethyl-2-thiouridylate)-methyltransferase